MENVDSLVSHLQIQDEPTPYDLKEATRFWPDGTADHQRAFAIRQLRTRRRLGLLLDFYRSCPCSMARVHLLTASTVAVGRLCGFSDEFNSLGDAIMPVDDSGLPRTELWRRYEEACRTKRPWLIRDEFWLEAHAQDWRALKAAKLDEQFFASVAGQRDSSHGQLLLRYAQMTFGAREFDHLSEDGPLPLETSISFSMSLAIKRFLRQGWPFFWRNFRLAVLDLLISSPESRVGVPTRRQIAWCNISSAWRAWSAWKVYRRGLRIQNRGVGCPEVDWPLLETLLGDDVHKVHPLIVRFYRNPGRFTAEASLDIHTLPLMFYSRFAALLLGQGLFEDKATTIPARLRVFQRQDGAMHFIRELYCHDQLRVFDSDFVLREVAGKTALVEVFDDLKVDVVLDAEIRPEGGVAVVGRDIYWRGTRLPRTALRVEFSSQVFSDPKGRESIRIVGRLDMSPRTRLGRFCMHSVLRRPNELGRITYILSPNGNDSDQKVEAAYDANSEILIRKELDPSRLAIATTLRPSPDPYATMLVETCSNLRDAKTHPDDHKGERDNSQRLRVGDYEILGEIARGGMGVVYKARHISLGRIAALKLIKSGSLADESEVRRFEVEAQAAAGLDHPGIVPVYEVGRQENQHYMAMAFVDGQSLWQLVKNAPLPPHDAARIMHQVAQAIQYAHERGIIHRDIKPQNILLSQDGIPKVTDFGLAKKQVGDSSLTATGQVLGTPSYMPPEQAAGKTAEIGVASDVYSLGATLYCLLTGRPPFQAATPVDTLIQVMEHDPVALRQLNSAIPRDLEMICLKCLRKDPQQRYASAAALADDLDRALKGELISASQSRWVDKLLHTLEHSRDDVEIATWSKILSLFAWIVPIPEIVLWLFGHFKLANPFVWGTRFRILEFLILGGILWYYRASWWPPRTQATRHMLSQWIAFVVACHLIAYVGIMTHGMTLSRFFDTYPYFAILSGVLWFTLGSNFWGYCYGFGVAFFVAATMMPLNMEYAPLEFAVLWLVTLRLTANRLNRLAGNNTSENQLAKSAF